MSAKSFIVLSRRLWTVRDQMYDACVRCNHRRWKSLLRREERLMNLILNHRLP